mgnify:FL=1
MNVLFISSKRVFSAWIIILFTSVFGLNSPLAWAEPILPLTATTDHLNLMPYLSVLPDPRHDYSIEEITRTQNQIPWQASKHGNDNINFGYTSDVYWFRLKIHNTTTEKQHTNIEIGYPVLDYLDVFIDHPNQEIQLLELGDKRAFNDRPVSHRNFIVPLDQGPEELVTLYFRVETTSSMQVPIQLWRDKTLLQSAQSDMLGLGLYFGTMGVMVLYNLFVFFSVRESNYLYYVCYVASIALFFASLSGVSFQYLWPENTWWNDQSIVFFLACVVMFAAMFTIRFLRIRETFPRLQHLANMVVFVSILITAATILASYSTMIAVVIAWAVFGISLAISFGVYRWMAGDSSAKYYCISWFTLLIGGVILALNKFDVLPRNFLTEHATQFGSAFEVILLSFALADRLNVEKRRRFEAQLSALENERVARLAQAEALQQEKNARRAQEQALIHERDARHAQAEALEFQRQATETLEYKVRERTQELEVANQRLEELTYTDGLTGIRNRRYLNRALEREFTRSRREKGPLAAIIVDIDHFKQFNDTHGHLAGDDCLRIIAKAIESCALRENDVVARYGGEEFMVLLPNTDEAGVMLVAEQIRIDIKNVQFDIDSTPVTVTASLGATACIPGQTHNIESFITAADEALYISKKSGRNQIKFRAPELASPGSLRSNG